MKAAKKLLSMVLSALVGLSVYCQSHAQQGVHDHNRNADTECHDQWVKPGWVTDYDVEGVATTVQGETLYIERLNFRFTRDGVDRGGRLAVEYRLPDGEVLANKTVHYHCRMTAPNFHLQDVQNDRHEGVIWEGNNLVSYQADTSERLSPPKGNLIIDAGFDHFVKENWQVLMDGESVKVHYLFPRDNVFIKLKVEKSPAPDPLSTQETEENPGITFFKISANNLLFRLFSSPIFVCYDDAQSLKYFIGPSNLPMMKEEKQVIIRYKERPY